MVPLHKIDAWQDVDGSVPLRLAIERYLAEHEGGNPSTLRAKKGDLQLFFKSFKGAALEAVDRPGISKWLKVRQAAGDSPATVRRRLATIKHFCAWAADEIDGYKNPARTIKGPRLSAPKFKALNQAQLAALRIAIAAGGKRDFQRLRDRFLIELLYNTGLRISEACRITEGQIEADRFFDVWGKGNRYADIPINESLSNWLERYLPARAALLKELDSYYKRGRSCDSYPLLISTWEARPSVPGSFKLSPRTARRVFAAACERANIPADLAHPHVLRHTFARRLMEKSNNNLPLVQKALRHQSINTTMIYTQSEDDELMEAISKL